MVRVMVCPVDNATFRIPFIFTIKLHCVTFFHSGYSRSQIDVVSDQQRLASAQPDDKSLMPRSIVVVGQHLRYDALPLYLEAALSVVERRLESAI